MRSWTNEIASQDRRGWVHHRPGVLSHHEAPYLLSDGRGCGLARACGGSAKNADGRDVDAMEASFYFVHALVLARAYREAADAGADAERDEILRTLTTYEKKLQFWAKNCPENFASKHRLVAGDRPSNCSSRRSKPPGIMVLFIGRAWPTRPPPVSTRPEACTRSLWPYCATPIAAMTAGAPAEKSNSSTVHTSSSERSRLLLGGPAGAERGLLISVLRQ